jgi:hypothetical protein
MNPHDLPNAWRTRAKEMRELGADAQACTLEYCAGELEQAQREWGLQELTLQEAAEACGFSYSTLQKMVASEDLPNVGEKGSPRVRRGDLPRKATKQDPLSDADGPDLAGELLLSKLGV